MYSPRIREDLIRPLYRLAKARRVPMTRLVSDILATALAAVQVEEVAVVEQRVNEVQSIVYRVAVPAGRQVEPTGDSPQQEG
jgi:hypothetical protein